MEGRKMKEGGWTSTNFIGVTAPLSVRDDNNNRSHKLSI